MSESRSEYCEWLCRCINAIVGRLYTISSIGKKCDLDMVALMPIFDEETKKILEELKLGSLVNELERLDEAEANKELVTPLLAPPLEVEEPSNVAVCVKKPFLTLPRMALWFFMGLLTVFATHLLVSRSGELPTPEHRATHDDVVVIAEVSNNTQAVDNQEDECSDDECSQDGAQEELSNGVDDSDEPIAFSPLLWDPDMRKLKSIYTEQKEAMKLFVERLEGLVEHATDPKLLSCQLEETLQSFLELNGCYMEEIADLRKNLLVRYPREEIDQHEIAAPEPL